MMLLLKQKEILVNELMSQLEYINNKLNDGTKFSLDTADRLMARRNHIEYTLTNLFEGVV